MTSVSGTGEESAVNTWLAGMIAKGQQRIAEQAAAKAAAAAAAEAAGLPPVADTVVELSDEAKARAAAHDWYRRADDALAEKDRILKAQWADAVKLGEIRTPDALRAKFSVATAAQKEAYVQLELIDFDTSMARDALDRQYCELINDFGRGPGYSDEEIARIRLEREFYVRQDVEIYSKVSPGISRSGTSQATKTASPAEPITAPAVAETSAASQKKAAQSMEEHILAELTRLRLSMGAGTGADSDPAVQRYARPSNGPMSTAEQLAAVQRSLEAAQSEYETVSALWQAAAARGEPWAVPQPRPPAAESSSTSTSSAHEGDPLYDAHHTTYAPEISYLTPETAKSFLKIIEDRMKRPDAAEFRFQSGYGDQAITDIKVYAAALKDFINAHEPQKPSVTKSVRPGGVSTKAGIHKE